MEILNSTNPSTSFQTCITSYCLIYPTKHSWWNQGYTIVQRQEFVKPQQVLPNSSGTYTSPISGILVRKFRILLTKNLPCLRHLQMKCNFPWMCWTCFLVANLLSHQIVTASNISCILSGMIDIVMIKY